jgi:hypothetical protein
MSAAHDLILNHQETEPDTGRHRRLITGQAKPCYCRLPLIEYFTGMPGS